MKSVALLTIVFALMATTAYSLTCGVYPDCASCDSSGLLCTSCESGYTLWANAYCIPGSSATVASSAVSTGVAMATWLLVVVIVVPIVIVLLCVIGIVCCVMASRRKRRVIATSSSSAVAIGNQPSSSMMQP